MNYGRLFLSFRGRIGRLWYWVSTLIVLVIGSLFNVLADLLAQTEPSTITFVRDGVQVTEPFLDAPLSNPVNLALLVVGIGIGLVSVYVNLAVLVKRWHDRNKSGWWSLIGLVPVLGWIWIFVECGLLRGDEGTNRFGTDPLIDPVEALDRRYGYEV